MLRWDESKKCSCKNLSWAKIGFRALVWEAEKNLFPLPFQGGLILRYLFKLEQLWQRRLRKRNFQVGWWWHHRSGTCKQSSWCEPKRWKTYVLPHQGWVSSSLLLQGWCSLVVTRNSSWTWEASSWWKCQTSCAVVHFDFNKLEFFSSSSLNYTLHFSDHCTSLLGSSRVTVFSPKTFVNSRWTWDKGSGQATVEIYFFTWCDYCFRCSSSLSPPSPLPPALLAEISGFPSAFPPYCRELFAGTRFSPRPRQQCPRRDGRFNSGCFPGVPPRPGRPPRPPAPAGSASGDCRLRPPGALQRLLPETTQQSKALKKRSCPGDAPPGICQDQAPNLSLNLIH